MGRKGQPLSLCECSSRVVKTMVETAAISLQKTYGDFGSLSTQLQCNRINMFLSSHLSPSMMHEVITSKIQSQMNFFGRDPRILASFYMHPSTKVMDVQDMDPMLINVPPYDTFWSTQLKFMSHIVSLTLPAAGYKDDTFDVLSASCPRLKELRSLDFPSERVARQTCRVLATAKGFGQLVKCDHLRRLTFPYGVCTLNECECILSTMEATNDTMVALFQRLPLEKLFNFDLPLFLEKNAKFLPQLRITDIDYQVPTPMSLPQVLSLCPKVRSLAMIGGRNAGIWTLHCSIAKIPPKMNLDKLAVVSLIVYDQLLNALSITGSNLTWLEVELVVMNQETYRHSFSDTALLIGIGRSCPNLSVLRMAGLSKDKPERPLARKELGEVLFTCLKDLSLAGDGWDVASLIELCLHNARDISHVSLDINKLTRPFNFMNTQKMDVILTDLYEHNPMELLESLEFGERMFISTKNMLFFIGGFPKLAKLVVREKTYSDIFKGLQMQMKMRNVDLDLICGKEEDLLFEPIAPVTFQFVV